MARSLAAVKPDNNTTIVNNRINELFLIINYLLPVKPTIMLMDQHFIMFIHNV